MTPNEKILGGINRELKRLEPELTASLMELVSIPAVSPVSGGAGEMKKAIRAEALCREAGWEKIVHYDAPSPAGPRPNLVATLAGRDRRAGRTWIIAHLDVVPPGDPALWQTDPYRPVRRGDRIYGRGTEDNGQSLIAALYLPKLLGRLGLQPAGDLCLALVADEETISTYGIKYMAGRKSLFRPGDFFIVPDGGSPDGSLIEVAEKALVWLEVRTLGRQCHGSMADQGINAMEAASVLVSRLERLRRRFAGRDPLYSPDFSSFEPTKRLANVPNINTIPGSDTFYIDCRILPRHPVPKVMGELKKLKAQVEKERRVKISLSFVQRAPATGTDPEAPEIKEFARTVRAASGVRTRVAGVGWGTCASFVRQAGYPAAVWSTVLGIAHQPNEYCLVSNLLNDARVFAGYLAGLGRQP
ncbi:MAG TPA: M20 family metallo-hydrolase [bacterium]|uniref:Acetylornithine deacetylase n=1 Tax=candidate division TA06 bacterium ADurb.Bin417 TaxID=1852828 RepID=A0A1V5MIZ9_UNCT6|nr:MAG: Acetylornithine deacetylase [candidate division TA06 bacterium ADurb.Bin417]HNQ34515.1 M20 family metallo-hydrolase [bacterium]HNS48039.1 M20 family metallo-hydrolase [bacterium]